MKISELVSELEVLWAQHGDVNVLTEQYNHKYDESYWQDARPRFDGSDVVL